MAGRYEVGLCRQGGRRLVSVGRGKLVLSGQEEVGSLVGGGDKFSVGWCRPDTVGKGRQVLRWQGRTKSLLTGAGGVCDRGIRASICQQEKRGVSLSQG